MNIGKIKRGWIRKPLVVVCAVFCVAALLILLFACFLLFLAETAVDWMAATLKRLDVPAAWRGPRA